MPFLLIPLLAGGAGFGLGFWASDGLGKAIKFTLVVGGGYVAYKYYKANA